MTRSEAARRTAEVLRARIGDAHPGVAVILGSGVGGFAEGMTDRASVPYADIPGFPLPTVVGHLGQFIAGTVGSHRVVALSGRFHPYEGHGVDVAGYPVRVMHELGARTLIVTNAAGGLGPSFTPGTIMLIRDHINLMFRNPLIGPVESGEDRFPDMSDPYDHRLRHLAHEVAASLNTPLEEGVYAGLLGPSYETKAEVKMLQRLGADATGMSTLPEVIMARACGMRVLGFSCITNLACGLSDQPITHEEVLETTFRVADRLTMLVTATISRLNS